MQLADLRNNYRDMILAIAAKYHASNVRVFGSVARGQQGVGSDIDFLVRFDSGASLLDEAGLDRELSALLKQPIDLIGEDVIRDEFRQFILNEAVAL
ncbi:MAG: nucleotidyltransferase family protein [Rickettsiales bacterium]